jgi:hypothetical protein
MAPDTSSADTAPLSFRMATPLDTPQILALLNQSFRTPINQSTWEWFTCGSPNGPSRVYVALEGEGTVVGLFGFAPLRLRVEGARATGAYVHHLVLKPEYRDGLSFVALSRYALREEASRGLAFAIGPPNRHSYPIHKTLMKWTDFASLDCLYKLSPSPRPHDCRELKRFTVQFDRFYERVAADLGLCLDKTAAWMNWRFLDRPGSPYVAYTIGDGEGLAGYIVLKQWQDANGYRKAHIMDLHAEDDAALSQLIRAAESYAIGCEELNFWALPGYAYRSSLEALGFAVRAEARQPLIARTFNGFCLNFPAGKSSLSYGDGDCQY